MTTIAINSKMERTDQICRSKNWHLIKRERLCGRCVRVQYDKHLSKDFCYEDNKSATFNQIKQTSLDFLWGGHTPMHQLYSVNDAKHFLTSMDFLWQCGSSHPPIECWMLTNSCHIPVFLLHYYHRDCGWHGELFCSSFYCKGEIATWICVKRKNKWTGWESGLTGKWPAAYDSLFCGQARAGYCLYFLPLLLAEKKMKTQHMAD